MDNLFESSDVKKIGRAISDCVQRTGWLAVVGPVGAGKTTAVDAALASMPDVRVIDPVCLDRRRMTVGSILEASIRDLSDEPVRASMEARSRQWRRIVGTASASGRVVLLIEEAHLLHHATLRALKRLREIAWAGRRPLVSIVMVAQPGMGADLRRVREVGLRVRQHQTACLTRAEVAAYLKWLGIRAGDAAAREISLRVRTPLEVGRLAEAAVEWANGQGHRQVTVEDVRAALGGDLGLRDRIDRSPLSVRGIAKLAGVSASAVSAVSNGNYAGRSDVAEKIAAAMDAVEHGGPRAADRAG